MGKKKNNREPKAAKKQEEPGSERVPEPSPAKKKGKKPTVTAQKVQNWMGIFSSSFRERVGNFDKFYKEFLEIRIKSENFDESEELSRMSEKVSIGLEVACSQILKQELKEVEEWIEKQQDSIQEQISKVEKAQKETKQTLEQTGTFSKAEISEQLKAIQEKQANLQDQHDQFGILRAQAVSIYDTAMLPEE